MPRHLFGRSLMIIVIPMLLVTGVVTVVFFDRHYRITTATNDGAALSTTVAYM